RAAHRAPAGGPRPHLHAERLQGSVDDDRRPVDLQELMHRLRPMRERSGCRRGCTARSHRRRVRSVLTAILRPLRPVLPGSSPSALSLAPWRSAPRVAAACALFAFVGSACTDVYLEDPRNQAEVPADRAVAVEGTFCTPSPNEVVRPIKIALVMDASQ